MTSEDQYVQQVREELEKVWEKLELDALEGEEEVKWVEFCKTLVNNPYWNRMIDVIRQSQLEMAGLEAKNYSEVTMNRAVVLAALSLKALVAKKAGKYEEKRGEIKEGSPESFEPFTPLR